MTGLFSSQKFETPCRVEIEQSPDHFHAHVELAGNVAWTKITGYFEMAELYEVSFTPGRL